jgi:histidinol-phosphate aminotransferase
VRREYALERIVKLASNENPFGPSPEAVGALTGMFNDLHLYPNGGYDLRVKLAEAHNLSPGNVIVGNGSEGIMSIIMRTFLNDDDEVLTTEAAFIGFQVLARARGIAYRTVPYRAWHYDLDAIASAITDRTKIIYLANPNNPTGTIFSRSEFDAFYRRVPARVLIIMDEAYYEYAVANPEYPDSMKYRYDNVITLRTFSKAHGLAGLRIGYGFAHGELIRNLLKVKLPFEPNTLAQAAALAALGDDAHLDRTLENNRKGLEYLGGALRDLGLETAPSCANFIMVVLHDEDVVNAIFTGMQKQGVIVRPLRAFGLPNCLRITVGTEEENTLAVGALRNVLSAQQG